MQNAEEEQQGEVPQDEPMDEPEYGPEGEQEESDSGSMNSTIKNRANEFSNY